MNKAINIEECLRDVSYKMMLDFLDRKVNSHVTQKENEVWFYISKDVYETVKDIVDDYKNRYNLKQKEINEGSFVNILLSF